MYARQSESFKDEECKSEGGTQRGLFIRAKRGINESNNWGGRGGGSWKANKSPFTATHATLVHELSDNDDG